MDEKIFINISFLRTPVLAGGGRRNPGVATLFPDCPMSLAGNDVFDRRVNKMFQRPKMTLN
jgi:hypothetical protein